MFRRLRKILDKMDSPELDWIQVEVTSHCNAACVYCPNSLFTKRQHMPLQLFNHLMPYLVYTDLVYLQGWGEPLLNSDLFDMIRMCKSKGKRVGFTTNGMLLNDENIRKIIDLDLDILCVSLAGVEPDTHNPIRSGTDFLKILANLDRLSQMKAKSGSSHPSIHIAYLLLVDNFREIKKVVELGKTFDVKEIVASNLTLIIKKSLYSQALFHHPDKWQFFINILEEVVTEAQQADLTFSYSNPVPEEKVIHCSENVCNSCVVSVDGSISPCVFTSPTLSQTADGKAGKRHDVFF